METKECPVCRSNACYSPDYDRDSAFYSCPVCGRFEITANNGGLINDNRLASYLYYNRFKSSASHLDKPEYRYHTTMEKELCDNYKKAFKEGNKNNGLPVHMDLDMVQNWYPKTFAERIDYILLRLNSLCRHIGSTVSLSETELESLLFIDRKEQGISANMVVWRNGLDCLEEVEYMLSFLRDSAYITYNEGPNENEAVDLRLEPAGYKRIDELQKTIANGKTVLVAMQFGEKTIPLREAIRKGISDAGYNAVYIDEVQHNDFITPELLKYIKDSKFVVVDLTHQNNGAYFEEGYAMGLGKAVIQLCQKDTKLHFDIAQKNTIMWKTEDDIPEMLKNRIQATID